MVLRRRLAVLLATAMMVVMAASPAWAAPGGQGQGHGGGIGGGDNVNQNDQPQAQKTRTGGGPVNNPNLGCQFSC